MQLDELVCDRPGLRELIVGSPVGSGELVAENARRVLRQHVRGLGALIRVVYGSSIATNSAVAEMDRLAGLCDDEATVCQRAALLYSLYRETEIQRYFASSPDDASYADDLVRRILPYLVPRYVRGNFQSPAGFVLGCVVLAELWAGERLGNWGACE